MQRGLKRLVERVIVASGVVALARARRQDGVLVLVYHNILPDIEQPAGDVSLHLPRREFARQLDAIRRSHDVVPLTAILEPRTGKKPRVAITFDDAYLGALTVAVPELVSRGMPATIFVAPGLLGTRTWWDSLADPAQCAVPDTVRHRALTEFAGDGASILRSLAANPAAPDNPSLRIGSEAELAAAARQPGISIGSHSWSHANLSALSSDVLQTELDRPMRWLRDRFTNYVPWLSYPYGLYSPAVEKMAASAGYEAAVRVDGGWRQSAAGSKHALPRYNIPSGLSIDGFRIRLGGIWAD